MSLREIKMERTRELIVEVAFSRFQEQGFAATTMEEIAAAAEVGTRTVYRYFPTKEALALSEFVAVFDASFHALRDCPEETSVSEVLRAGLESLLRSYEEEPDRLRAAHAIAHETPSVRAHFAYLLETHEATLQQEVAHRIGGASAELLASLAVAQTGAVFGSAVRKWYTTGAPDDLRKQVRAALQALRAGEVPAPAPLA
ncbi:TetR/AcrR family transcriptional regulator [Actinoalloteichus hymeniacidonis]|uniref:Transcriptional regulator, TetR family n=1 Tax=Actinoalloteichus hymeniacidonis TaxID=340345 RepID=A0AAC9HR64_9PSEU|nr:TetR/AcrR family transcriptional regulator [Actinoalloteichus hymeniacidonis]AOS63933.1 transcriptional regulator, TetR family [Actinoalloteichus hymeniacidonis]MBB5908010.1 AcrR family transcriptional regulator [Actinoalloteichus hymeniacidonis]